MRKILNDCFTGKDNCTVDAGRVLLVLGGLAFIVYAGWEVFKTSHFAAQDFGIGFGGILGGGGAGLALKAKTEPEPTENNDDSR